MRATSAGPRSIEVMSKAREEAIRELSHPVRDTSRPGVLPERRTATIAPWAHWSL